MKLKTRQSGKSFDPPLQRRYEELKLIKKNLDKVQVENKKTKSI